MSDLRTRAVALYTPPFRYAHGYIYDSRGHMVADQGGSEEPSSLGLRVRGWGRIGGMPESAALQDSVGVLIAELLTANWPDENRGADAGRPSPRKGGKSRPLCNECLVRGRTTCRAEKNGSRCPLRSQSSSEDRSND